MIDIKLIKKRAALSSYHYMQSINTQIFTRKAYFAIPALEGIVGWPDGGIALGMVCGPGMPGCGRTPLTAGTGAGASPRRVGGGAV